MHGRQVPASPGIGVIKKRNPGRHSPANKDRIQQNTELERRCCKVMVSIKLAKHGAQASLTDHNLRLSKVREPATDVQLDAIRQQAKLPEEGALIGRELQDAQQRLAEAKETEETVKTKKEGFEREKAAFWATTGGRLLCHYHFPGSTHSIYAPYG